MHFKIPKSCKSGYRNRRCGKSSLLKLMILHLKENGIAEDQILEMNFESYAFKNMNSDSFYQYVREHIIPNKRMYLFFDEVQRVPKWEDAINSFRVDFNCDIYVTGSNAYMLSSEYATPVRQMRRNKNAAFVFL